MIKKIKDILETIRFNSNSIYDQGLILQKLLNRMRSLELSVFDTNKWYLLAVKDENNKFGYQVITPKGEFFESFQEADYERIYLQPDHDDLIVVLERSCRPVYGE